VSGDTTVRLLDQYRSTDPKLARVLEDRLIHRRSRRRVSSNVAEKDYITRAREDIVIGRPSPGGPYDPRPSSWPSGRGFHIQTSPKGCFQARTVRLSR
jgi:hypothetical protein